MNVTMYKHLGKLHVDTDRGNVTVYRDQGKDIVNDKNNLINEIGGQSTLFDLYDNWGYGNARREYIDTMKRIGHEIYVLNKNQTESLSRLNDTLGSGFRDVRSSLEDIGDTVESGFERLAESLSLSSLVNSYIEYRIMELEETRQREFERAAFLLETEGSVNPDMTLSDFLGKYKNVDFAPVFMIIKEDFNFRKGMTLRDLGNEIHRYLIENDDDYRIEYNLRKRNQKSTKSGDRDIYHNPELKRIWKEERVRSVRLKR
jgi:hypothetical protein